MRINEVITENVQLDELSLGGIGKGLAKGASAAAKSVGAIAGGAVGAIDAAKQGYNAGKSSVSGKPTPGTQPGSADINQLTQSYSNLSAAARAQLRQALDIVDDQDRLSSGTTESIEQLLKLAGRN